ncbi:MAG: LysR family transcriptional regulator [Burkholderiaceae bacterium]|nr:LysR family transcriptional regulator [Burkholderiaceae bacterium]
MPRKPVTDTTAVAPPPGPALADWNLLRSFITVHETGTLTEAARRLGTTQPSVGRHVRELEAAVGEALFVRRPGRLEPTQRGHDLYATVAGMRHAVASAQSLFSGAQEGVVGTVRVAASEVYAYHVVTPILAALLGEHPGLEIALSVSNRADNLLRRDADIAVRFFRPEQDDLIAVHVGNTELGLYAHESYLQRFGEPTGFDVPEDAFVAGFDRETAPIGPFLKTPAAALQVRFRLRTDAMLSRQAAVETGCGIGVFLADVAAERPGLRRVLAGQFGQPQQVWLCAHAELRRSASMRVVWERLESRLRARLAAHTQGSNV